MQAVYNKDLYFYVLILPNKKKPTQIYIKCRIQANLNTITRQKGELNMVKSNPTTKDDDKNPENNNEKNREKNILAEHNREMGKHQYSKKTDHL
jgi:hypothetical protein